MKPINHIYIHIPFCRYICSYCDFCKKFVKNQNVDRYLDYLEKELQLYHEYPLKPTTIYIGGGTPSVLESQQLRRLSQILNTYIDLSAVEEFSFEINPDDISTEYLQALKELGINRLSIGVQSTNSAILKKIGRNYTGEQVTHALKIVDEVFSNYSIDLMFGLPNQTLNDIKEDIQLISELNPPHISWYNLILENNTKIIFENNQYLDEDEQEQVYKLIQEKLANLGYHQYEISNWSQPGLYAKHNRAYWDQHEYLGLGLGASSYINNERFTTTFSLRDYEEGLNNKKLRTRERFTLTTEDYEYETIMLGLRTTWGISRDYEKFIPKSYRDYFCFTSDRMKIKTNYYFISNDIIIKILTNWEQTCKNTES